MLNILKQKGEIIVGLDRKYHVPVIETSFYDYYEISVRLWPKISAHSEYHFPIKTTVSSGSEDFDTAF